MWPGKYEVELPLPSLTKLLHMTIVIEHGLWILQLPRHLFCNTATSRIPGAFGCAHAYLKSRAFIFQLTKTKILNDREVPGVVATGDGRPHDTK